MIANRMAAIFFVVLSNTDGSFAAIIIRLGNANAFSSILTAAPGFTATSTPVRPLAAVLVAGGNARLVGAVLRLRRYRDRFARCRPIADGGALLVDGEECRRVEP